MPIVVLIIALAAYAYALITEPGIRRWGLIGGAAVGLGLAVYLWQTAPETTRAALRIDPEELVLDQLAIEPTPRGATLAGRVHNTSARWRLRDMTLTLRLRDCPEAASPPDTCPVIGEARAVARPDAPPGQIRAFSASFIFANLPEPAGTLGWDWQITEVRATE
jgi:hypothetical protein